MNVLLVILHADPARGGAERYTVDLARGLVALGHAVTLAASSFGAPIEGVESIRLGAGGWSRLGRYQRFLQSVRELTQTRTYDIVHAMLPVETCDLYHPHAGIAADAIDAGHAKYRSQLARVSARFLNRLNRKRRFFAEVERAMLMGLGHESRSRLPQENPRSTARHGLEARATEDGPSPSIHTDGPRVLCLSQYIKEAARRHYPIDAHRLPILLNGVDLHRFDPQSNPAARDELRGRLGLSAQHVVALMIAQDFQRKGLAEAIEAVAKVAGEGLRLVVVGRPDPSAYRRLSQRLGVAERILFAGATDRPVDFYRMADFFVLPTRHDPCSLVVLEALAMGLPVISTTCNGACEAMTDGTHGVILPDPADVPALAHAMRQMLDTSARQHMQQACIDLRGHISQQHHVRRMVEIYAEIAGERRRR